MISQYRSLNVCPLMNWYQHVMDISLMGKNPGSEMEEYYLCDFTKIDKQKKSLDQIKCIYKALLKSADISKCCTETQPKTPNSKQCRCRSTVASKNSLETAGAVEILWMIGYEKPTDIYSWGADLLHPRQLLWLLLFDPAGHLWTFEHLGHVLL